MCYSMHKEVIFVNDRLRDLRKALGLNQVEFGERIGIGGTAISKIEKGDRGLTEALLRSICREFNVNEEWLRYGTGQMFSQKNTDLIDQLSNKYDLGLYGRQLLETYLELSDADKRAVERFVVHLTANVEEAERQEQNRIGSSISVRKKAMNL